MKNRTILQGDALHKLAEIEDNSIDLIATDPPYGYSFMNKDWDKAVVSVDIWKECLRVLKPGSWAFVMSAPRQDVLSHMIVNLTDAGFKTDFTSIYWAYASGFPKAMNISKAVDKKHVTSTEKYQELDIYSKQQKEKLGKYLKDQREKLNIPSKTITRLFPSITGGLTGCLWNWENGSNVPTLQQWEILKQKLDLDDRFDELIEREETQRGIAIKKKKTELITTQREVIGKQPMGDPRNTFGGKQVETKKTSFDITKSETPQAKALDGSYAGYQPKPAVEVILVAMKPLSEKNYVEQAMNNKKGVTWLDDVRIPHGDNIKSVVQPQRKQAYVFNSDSCGFNNVGFEMPPDSRGRFPANLLVSDDSLDVIEDFSRYYSLDAWEAQFIVTPKPSKSEKNKGLDSFLGRTVNDGRDTEMDTPYQRGETVRQNVHPTVKPVSLFKYLVTMGSRPNDTVLDPFLGSGTTAIAAELTARNWIGIELNPEYEQIIRKRIATLNNSRLDDYISL